ncbi:MAG: leucine-rich repeat protein [Ruminococcus sp.]|nr:leucine-rich repeat protein [Ruminococcus sp.]
MNIRKHVSAAFIAMITALNTVSVTTGNAQIKTDMNIIQTTVKEESEDCELSFMEDYKTNGYYIAIGVKDTETDVPAQVDDFTVSKLCLDRVYLADDFPKGEYGTDHFTLNIPDGVEVVIKNWKCAMTGIPCIKLVYASGETEIIKADDYDEMAEQTTEDLKNDGFDITEDLLFNAMVFSLRGNPQHQIMAYPIKRYNATKYYTYTGEDSLTYLGVNVSREDKNLLISIPDEYDGKKIDRIKLGDVVCQDNIDSGGLDSVELFIPEGVELDPDVKWNAYETGFRTIMVCNNDAERKAYYAMVTEMGDDTDTYDTSYYTYTGEDSLTYLGVNVGMADINRSVNIPDEYDGKKIDRIKLSDVVCPESIYADRLDAIELYLPEGVELDPDVMWTAKGSGLHTIVVYDSDLERKEYHVWPSEMSDLYIYSNDYDFDDLNANIDLSEIKFRFADQEDMSEPTNVYSENLKLRVPFYAKIISDKWLAADTNILQITVCYTDGKKEIYKAEDYDYYRKESGNFKEYNRILSNWNYSGHMEVFGDENFNDEALWIFSDYEDIDRIPEYTDGSRLVVDYLGPWHQNIDVDELKFPDNLKELYLEDAAFENVNINKLILPGCKLFYDDNTFAESNIKEVIFDGDVSLKHNTFRDNPNLENVTFKGKADLDFSAFWGCKALKNINIDMDASFDGMAFDDCHELMTINGESPLDESGDLKPEFEGFVRGNFNASAGIGFIDKYLDHSIKKAVSEAVTDDMSDIEKVRALHDKLCSMTKYDTGNEEAKKNHVDGSVFLNDSTVCDGYARAMNLLLHEAGIESCYVGTTDHAWVIVKLGDHYFHVDPTWDDGTDVVYDWFLDSDDEIKDDPSHAGWKLMCPSELHSFQWEKMPKCTDKMGDVNEDDILDGRDASAILNGYAKTSAGGDSDIDSIIGDYDFNGVVDGRDASAVLTAYTKASSVQ